MSAVPSSDDRVAITGVLWSNVPPVWGIASDVLSRAVDRGDFGYDLEDLLKEILSRRMQLWMVGDGQAWAITQIQVYPRFKELLVAYLAGDGLDEWFDDLMDTLEAYARSHQCRHVEVFGRRGWKKIGAQRGYREGLTVLRKKL